MQDKAASLARSTRDTTLAVAVCAGALLTGLVTRTGSAAPATQPTTAPALTPERARAQFLENQRQQRQQFKDETDSMPVTARVRRDGIYRLFMEKGRIGVEVGPFQADQMTRVAVEDADGTWLATSKMGRVRRVGNPTPVILVNRYDFDSSDPAAVWETDLNINVRTINISCHSMLARMIYFQTPDGVTLTVVQLDPAGGPPQIDFNGRAKSLDQLRQEHPAEVRDYLTPMLAKLMPTPVLLPGPADVYEVFTSIAPDPAVAGKVEEILPDLDSPSPADRKAAAAKLGALGPSAALVAIRRDKSDLSPEQQAALDALVKKFRGKKAADPKAAARDPEFLLDCLELDAPGVRQAAFDALQKVMNRKLGFNPALSGAEAEKAADHLRQELAPLITASEEK